MRKRLKPPHSFGRRTAGSGTLLRRHRAARAKNLARGVLALACAAGIAGCAGKQIDAEQWDTFARFDHTHDDTDQKHATDASSTFDSPLGVLADTVSQDLDALKAYQQTTAAASEKLHETLLADVTTSYSWNQLRDNLLVDLGVDVNSGLVRTI